MNPMRDDEVRTRVRERYAASATQALQHDSCRCSGDAGSPCCGTAQADPITSDLYDPTETPFVEALSASLGCGNPTALADLAPGEDVLDLGSGGGLDVLLSARRVGPTGMAYGLDMTPEMLELAEDNRAKKGIDNARFIRGTIEDIPLPNASVDVIISNCVVNLSPDKDAVLREAHRVLRPAGRFAVSDIVLLRDIPDELRGIVALWTGCVSGALLDRDYVAKLEAAGFRDASIGVTRRYERSDLDLMADQLAEDGPGVELPTGMSRSDVVDALEGAFASAFVRAHKAGSGA